MAQIGRTSVRVPLTGALVQIVRHELQGEQAHGCHAACQTRRNKTGTFHMSKPVIAFVFKVLRNGLLPSAMVCCFNPIGDMIHLQKRTVFFFICILPCYMFIGFCNRFSRGGEYVGGNASARLFHPLKINGWNLKITQLKTKIIQTSI